MTIHPITPQQAMNNFKRFLELSPRNSYKQYRAAVNELASLCLQSGIQGDDAHPVHPVADSSSKEDAVGAAKRTAFVLNGQVRHAHNLACADDSVLAILLRGLISDAVKLQNDLNEIEGALQ